MALMSQLVAVASQTFPRLSSRVLASSGYTLDLDSFGPDAFGVWRESTARRQERSWQPIVAEVKAGRPREDVAALFASLDFLRDETVSILEVGCGGGYNSEILAHRYPHFRYSGIDLSSAMIDIARESYPNREFRVGSAYDLDVADDAFDVVLDGVALLHMPDWRLALSEYARTAKRFVVLHGLTLTDTSETTTFAKYAYGQPSLEIVLNRAELVGECARVGLVLDQAHPGLDYDLASYIGVKSVSETWVLAVSD